MRQKSFIILDYLTFMLAYLFGGVVGFLLGWGAGLWWGWLLFGLMALAGTWKTIYFVYEIRSGQ